MRNCTIAYNGYKQIDISDYMLLDIREHRGIYRLARFPASAEGQYVLWSLWSRGRDDIPRGVYSHQTALSMYELSDVMPTKLHLAVPRSFRRNTAIPEVLVLHKASLSRSSCAMGLEGRVRHGTSACHCPYDARHRFNLARKDHCK